MRTQVKALRVADVMNSVPMQKRSISRFLVRSMLAALLLAQFAWADHFHLDDEQNTSCSVCVYADNTPAITGTDSVQPLDVHCLDHVVVWPAQDPLSPPAFNHHSRAPPAH